MSTHDDACIDQVVKLTVNPVIALATSATEVIGAWNIR